MIKSKKIIELERQVSDLKRDIEEKDKEIAALKSDLEKKDIEIKVLKKELSGERVCSPLCQNCIHAIPYPVWNGLNTTNSYMCEQNNKCKDYNRKD